MKKLNIFITDSDYSCDDRSFFYLLGFQPSLGTILIGKDKFYLILDGRYFAKTKNIDEEKIKNILGKKNLKFEYIESKDFLGEIEKIAKKENYEKLVFEGKIAGEYIDELVKKTNKKYEILKGGFFNKKRQIKTNLEKENIKKAIKIIDKVFEYIQVLNQKNELIGKTEKQIRGIIISKIFEFGGEEESFNTIVAFGENSAIPHYTTGNTIIQNGVLLIDMGAKYNGYCSDFTRTFWVGEKNESYKKFEKIYNIVQKAHLNAFENAKVGMTGKEIDLLTREMITKEGYGDYFIHGTGHSLGLDIHENPFINLKSNEKIKENMVFTIEPGIYLPGEFGIRIEDIVFVEDGMLKKYSGIKI